MAETVKGGRYLVKGQWVDANGQPVAAPEKPKATSRRADADKADESKG